MKICITGTPGTGKTMIAETLSKKLKFKLIDLNNLCEGKKCFSGYDKKRKCKIVDTWKLKKEAKKIKGDTIFESHYSHDMDCDLVVLLRLDPKELKKRLEKKKWLKQKIQENIDAEIMEVIKSETYSKYPENKVIEIDSRGSVKRNVDRIVCLSGIKDLKLPESIRNELKTPFGRLFSDMRGLRKFLEGKKRIITVGDETSLTLIGFGLKPDLIIFDNMVKRKPDSRLVFKNPIVANNPAGWITVELFSSIKNNINKVGKVIKVVGEEDLAVLPCILFADEGSLILYGQPNEGVVVIEIDRTVKQRAQALVGRMA